MTSRATTSFWGRFYRDRDGGPIVELALVAPLLLALGLGVNEFGNAVQSYHVIDKGVRDAARFLARQTAPACGGTVPSITQAKNLAMYGNTAGSGNPVLSFWTDPTTITVTVTCIDDSSGTYLSPNGGTQIPIVTAEATVPYVGFGFLAYFGLGSPTFDTQHQELMLPE
jgi:TadE-like protein